MLNETLTPNVGDIIPPGAMMSHRQPGGARTMDFPEAIREVTNGKRITRVSWLPSNDYALLKDGWLSVYTKGEIHTWSVSDGDLEGRDWIVLPEGIKETNGKTTN